MYKMHVCMFVLKAYDVCNVIHNFSCLQDTADVKSGSQPSSYYSALCDVQASSGKVKDVFFFVFEKENVHGTRDACIICIILCFKCTLSKQL